MRAFYSHRPSVHPRSAEILFLLRGFSPRAARLRTSIVEGISVFLSLFDDNPQVKRVFCPPKKEYQPHEVAQNGTVRTLPSFSDLIEQGKVVALNFPVALNPGLARIIGTLMKQDFERAVLNRIP